MGFTAGISGAGFKLGIPADGLSFCIRLFYSQQCAFWYLLVLAKASFLGRIVFMSTPREELPLVIERLSSYSAEDAYAMGLLRHWESPKNYPAEPLPETMVREIIEDPANCVIVTARLATSGQIIGTESLNVIKSPDVGPADLGKIAYLGFVCTDPEYRSRGVFGKVWVEGLGWCDERSIDTIDFTSNPNNDARSDAIRFYKKHGAVERNTTPWRVNVKKALELGVEGMEPEAEIYLDTAEHDPGNGESFR